MPLRFAWLIAFLLVPLCAQADPGPSFAEALNLFRKAQAQAAADAPAAEVSSAYRAAAQRFQRIHDEEGVISARLFANAGNAYALAGDLGESALWYSRALLLDPDQAVARDGLEVVRRQLPWQPPPSVTEDLLGTLFFWHRGLSWSARKGLFFVLWPLAFLLLGLGRRRKGALLAGCAALVLGLALAGSLVQSLREGGGEDRAVLVLSATGRTGDGPSYGPSHSAPLPAGSELLVQEIRPGWLHVELRDGSRGWVRAEAAAWVIPR